MNTQYLRELICLAETKNFWEASALLYMNQSTLSKHIRALEAELGAELFKRTTRRVELTDCGRIFLPHAREIIQAEFEGTSAIKRLKNIEDGLLTIATIPVMAQYGITRLLAEYRRQDPSVTVRITEDDSSHLREYLENKSCELMFIREEKSELEYNFLNSTSICHIPYATDHLIVLLKRSHPLAGAKSLSLKQLKDEHFCLIKEGSLLYRKCADACRNAGFLPDIVFSSHRIDSIVDMVAGSDCLALLMDRHLAGYEDAAALRKNLVKVDIVPEVQSQISLCYRTDIPLSSAAEHFVNFCREKIINRAGEEY